MPRIRLSTETIRPVSRPNLRLSHDWISGIHAMRETARYQYAAERSAINAIDTAIFGAGRIKDIVVRRAEKEADEAATVWEASMIAGLDGTIGQDGQRHGGILQKSWTDYEDGKSSPITDLGEIEKNFQASDTYKNLSGLAREKFNQRVMTRRAHYLGAANRQFDRNSQERTAFFDKQADDLDQNEINKAVYLKDDKFESVCRDRTFKMQGRKFRNLMENPEILDQPDAKPDKIKWKDPKAEVFFNGAILTENRKNAIGRVAILAENAAASEITWSPDGRLTVNDAQIAAAEEYAKKIAEPYIDKDGVEVPARISQEETKALGYKCLQARSMLDRRVAETLAAESANALAKGDLASLEAAEKKFAVTAESFKGNQQRESAALIAKNKVSKAADERATYDIMNRLANGENLSVTVQGPDGKPVTTSIFDPKTQARYSRLYPQVQAAWNEKVRKVQTKEFKAQHDMSILEAEAKMLEYAGDRVTANGVERANPQEYLNYLAKKVVDKKLLQSDFTKLRDKFQTGWLRGYKGQNGKMPRQMEIAGQMLDVVKSELGVGLWTAVEKDEFGGAKIDKNGLVKLDEKGERPNVEYSRNRDMWFDATEKFTTEEMIGIINMSLSLANCDGLELAYDPTDPTKKLDNPHKVNSVEDFRTFIRGLKDSKRVLSAAQEMRRRAGYAAGVRAAADVADRQRLNEMMVSKPMTSSSDDETEEE